MPWVQVGERLWLPRVFVVSRTVGVPPRFADLRFRVTVELLDPSTAAGVGVYDRVWSVPVARMVEVLTLYGEVRDKDLRAVRIVDMVEAGAAALAKPSRPSKSGRRQGALQRVDVEGARRPSRLVEVTIKPPVAAPPAPGDPEIRHARTLLRRPRVELATVAEVYRAAQDAGRRDPTVAVATHIGKARSTAAAYVSKARAAGLLPPVDAP